jgi:hypothetical protein
MRLAQLTLFERGSAPAFRLVFTFNVASLHAVVFFVFIVSSLLSSSLEAGFPVLTDTGEIRTEFLIATAKIV